MISCKEYAKLRKEQIKEEIRELTDKRGIAPRLVVIQIDDNEASSSYIKYKHKDCDEVGVIFECVQVDSEKLSQRELEWLIHDICKLDTVHGLMIQLPIPDKYNLDRLIEFIPKEKDVDGFKKDSLFTPCTPKGIIDWLKHNQYDFVGKNITVLGRSRIVGKPLVDLLIDESATVTCCNSKTKLRSRLRSTKTADMVISAVGKAKFLNYSDFYNLTGNDHIEIIIDVGTNRDENGKRCGDVNREYFDTCLPDTYITPVTNGVGLLTRLSLIENVVKAYKIKH